MPIVKSRQDMQGRSLFQPRRLRFVVRIKIIGVFSQDLSFKENVTARGVSGMGIYAKGTLEAVYTGGNLSIGQLTQMTSGDGSTAAMNN